MQVIAPHPCVRGGVTQSTADGSGVNYTGNCPPLLCGHGTLVAGIAAGKGSSFSGVAKDASLIAINVFSFINDPATCGGWGSTCTLTYTSDLLKGLQRVYELRNTYNIASVNMSLGGGRYYDRATCDASHSSIKTAIDNLRAAGIATVISSGNDGYLDSISEPACISSAISVGSTWDVDNGMDPWCTPGPSNSSVDQVACYSNSASFLDLLAPGSLINSSLPGGGYYEWHGTSFAAPHVAGAWALLKQKNSDLTVSDGLAALSSTGVLVTDQRNNIVKPRIQVDAALDTITTPCNASLDPTTISAIAEPTYGSVSVTADTGCGWTASSNADWITITSGDTGIGNGTVAYYTDTNLYPDERTGIVSIAGLTLTVTQTGTPDTTAPTTPTALTAKVISASQINLSWAAATDFVGVTEYQIFRDGNLIAHVNSTSYSDTGLTFATSYSYTVAACDAAGNCSSQSPVISATTSSDLADLVLNDLTNQFLLQVISQI